MEPMNLGSAPTSPSSPPTNSILLPNILMGDDFVPSTPHNPTISPGRNRTRTPGSFKSPANVIEGRYSGQSWFNGSQIESPVPQLPYGQKKENAGPPTTSLFHAGDRNPMSPVSCGTLAYHGGPTTYNENISRIHSEETFNSSRNLSNSRFERIDSYWVTVFGFPPSSLNMILSQLSNCGMIVEKRMAQGNWVHVRFSNFNEVSKALSLNGKIISHDVMIGVQLHYPKENKENSGMMTSPIRALNQRHSYISPQHASNNLLQRQNLPQKSTGLFSSCLGKTGNMGTKLGSWSDNSSDNSDIAKARIPNRPEHLVRVAI
ncbi:unnamed protein product [Ceutorhynchus assimilis]|uniref:Nucleoporin NUP35 n=1 Tax=Ceutorhynchus assimilis TaxID=467358 RepID=A0A9P0DIE0_9CUCU|nr:unnamed protein product [Ceutorhynchus assimilis]